MTDHPVMNHTQYRLLGCFLLLVAASSTTSCDSPPRASLSPAKEEVHVPETAALDVIFPLSEQRQSRLETAVEHWRAPYDEEARLLRMSGKTYNPHSNLTEMPAELTPRAGAWNTLRPCWTPCVPRIANGALTSWIAFFPCKTPTRPARLMALGPIGLRNHWIK